ncbi:hypothetical protein Tco_1356141, partial [Tanacetum coccineum]
GVTPEAIKELITRRVAEALVAREANPNLVPIVESEIENGKDDGKSNCGGNGNGNDGWNETVTVAQIEMEMEEEIGTMVTTMRMETEME